jgi:hypothetical protein
MAMMAMLLMMAAANGDPYGDLNGRSASQFAAGIVHSRDWQTQRLAEARPSRHDAADFGFADH